MLFAFNPDEVREFIILKRDPITHENWSVSLSRTRNASLNLGQNFGWKITSAPQGKSLIDSQANTTLINHVISTFQTLHVNEFAAPGALEQMGLDAPHYTLKWSTSSATYQIEFGAPVGYGSDQSQGASTSKRYGIASVDAAATPEFAVAQKEKTKPLVVDGATLQMLTYLSDFASIRERRLAPYESDQIDTIHTSNSKSTFYATRNGDEWLDRRHKKLTAPIQDWLQSLTHLRIAEFIDDEAEAKKTQKLLSGVKPEQTITLEPTALVSAEQQELKGPIRITFYRDSMASNQIYAEISTRKHSTLPSYFKLFPESLVHLYAPKYTKKLTHESK